MKRPPHVNILGVDIPLATIAYATSTVPGPTHATLGEWNNYYNESSPDIAKVLKEWEEEDYRNCIDSLKSDSHLFLQAAERRIPMHMGISRQLFQYGTLSDPAYDGSI